MGLSGDDGMNGYRDMSEQSMAFIKIGEALSQTMVSLAEELRPALERFGEALKVLHEISWRVYREAGAPYGETEEGMWRWMGECATAERFMMEAERLISWHRVMADLRRRFRKS